MVIAGNCYHCRIVGGELELGKECPPAPLLAFENDSLPEGAVGRYASAYADVLDAGLRGGLDEFVQQNVYQGFLERGTEVTLVLLDEVRVSWSLTK